ncbi:hypothetical protein ACOSP7_018958 [Xanthoceras sorbifolium]
MAIVNKKKLQVINLHCLSIKFVRRNKWVHSQLLLSTDEVVDWSASFLHEFEEASIKFAPSRIVCDLKWSSGCFKIDIDASCDSKNGYVGIGMVICNTQGLVLVVYSHIIKQLLPVDIVEAMAINCGLQLALKF